MFDVTELIKVGFVDVSSDKNGLAFRKRLPGEMMEIAYYVVDGFLRFQTIRSGVTIPLKGVTNMAELYFFWKYVTGGKLF